MEISDGTVSYVLDSATRLIAVGGAWDRFAIENGARELLAPQPLGRPVGSFISDATTSQLYDALFANAKRTGMPITFPIRCDAPTIRRRLRLTVRYDRDRFLVNSVLESAVRREAVPVGTARPAPAPAHFTVSCSWCKRVKAGNSWLEVEDALATLRIFDADRVDDFSHGICDACLHQMDAMLAAT